MDSPAADGRENEEVEVYRIADRQGIEGGGAGTLAELTRKHGIRRSTYFNWRSKYGGVAVNELKRMDGREAGNAELKRMYSELPQIPEAPDSL